MPPIDKKKNIYTVTLTHRHTVDCDAISVRSRLSLVVSRTAVVDSSIVGAIPE